MERPDEFVSFIKDFNGSYLISICEPECLATINQFPALKDEILKRISSLNPSEGLHQALIYGLKKYAGEVMTKEEINCIKIITRVFLIRSPSFLFFANIFSMLLSCRNPCRYWFSFNIPFN